MAGLTINSRELNDGWMALAVEGEIDLATVDELEEAIEDIYSTQSAALVVDLTGSSFMDSSGLRALVMANRKFDGAGRSFAIAVRSGPISRLIDLSGVDSSIRTVESVDELAGS